MSEIRIARSQSSAGNFYYTGKINDFRIYDHALSAAEVHELSQGLVRHYKLNSFYGGYGNPNLCKNSRTFGTGWSGSGAITQNAFNSFAVKYKDNTSGTSYSDTVSYSAVTTVNPNEVYTVSFWAKADIAHSVNCFFFNNTSGVVQVLNSVSSTGSTGTSTDGNTYISLTTKWKYYWITWTFKNTGTAATKSLIIGRNTAGSSGVYVAQVKMERGASATPWTPHPDDNEPVLTKIEDSSGYNKHGSIVGSITIENDAPRYNYITHMNTTSTTNHIEAGALPSTTQTVSFWLKCAKTQFCAFADSTSGMSFGYVAGNSAFYVSSTTASAANSMYGFTIPNFSTTEWNHIVVQKIDKSTFKVYLNGIEQTARNSTNNSWTSQANDIWLFNRKYSSYATTAGADLRMSDFRAYTTLLSEDDIKALYYTEAKIDRSGNIHSYSFEETETEAITNNGQVTGHNIAEFCPNLHYDRNVYVEPDGSKWIHIAHHNNPNGGVFASSSLAWNKGVYENEDRWYDVEQTMGQAKTYEFMVKQATTNTATEVKYRWIQTESLLTATYTTVKPADVTRITTTGYTDGGFGGVYIKNGNARLCIANSTSSNWYGAIGCWTVYQSGIPGYPNTVITTGYIDLYFRIDNFPNTGAKILKDIGFSANNFVEM